jgi:hypothetical protein
MTSRRQFLGTSSAAVGFALGGRPAQTESAIGQQDSDKLPPTMKIVESMSSKLSEILSVKDFGALGNGIADDSAAITACLAAIVALGGGTVRFPTGTYIVGTRIPLVGAHNVSFVGAGIGATILKARGSRTSLFSSFPEPNVTPSAGWQGSQLSFAHMTLDMDYNVNVDGGVLHPSYGTSPAYAADNYQYPILAYLINGICVEHCSIKNCWYNGIELYTVNDYHVEDITFSHVGDKANYLGYYSCLETDGFSHRGTMRAIRATDVGNVWIVNADPNSANPDGLTGAFDLTLDDVSVERVQLGGIQLLDDVARVTIQNVKVKDAQGNVLSVRYPHAGTNNAKAPRHLILRDFNVDGYNLANVSGVAVLDLTCYESTVSGIIALNSLGRGIKNYYGIIARQVTETLGGVPTNQSGLDISGCFLKGSFANAYGINAVAKNTYVHDNTIVETSGIAIATISATGVGCVVRENPGYNPVGASAIMVTASPFTYTAGVSPENVSIIGGTVSSVTKGGVQLASATGVVIHLEPAQSMIVTYSTAPTIAKDIE